MILLAQKRACALCARALPISLQFCVVAQEFDCIARHGLDVANVGQKSVAAMLDDFRNAARRGWR